jgi:hypothetical protein
MKTSPESAAAVGACSLVLALTLAVPAAAHAADAAAAQSVAAPDAPADPTSSNRKDQLQEVVVTGIRANLEKALTTKEFAPVVLDSIDSTQLGRFPDSDVADSLEHLPGITISRTTGGRVRRSACAAWAPSTTSSRSTTGSWRAMMMAATLPSTCCRPSSSRAPTS